MATLSITKSYGSGRVLQKSHLDDIENAVETFLNTTKLGYENIDIESTFQSLTQAQAETILTTGGFGTLVTTSLSSTAALTSVAAYYNTTTTVAAGTYLIVAIANVEAVKTSSTSIVSNTVVVDLYNATSGAIIVPTGIVNDVGTGLNSSAGIFTAHKVRSSIGWVYPVTITTTSQFAFRASHTGNTGDTADLIVGSCIQLYRIRS